MLCGIFCFCLVVYLFFVCLFVFCCFCCVLFVCFVLVDCWCSCSFILLCVCVCLVCLLLPVSLDCPFFIAPSVSPNVYSIAGAYMKIKPNSVRIRFLSCQNFVLHSTGFELTPLIHCSTNR